MPGKPTTLVVEAEKAGLHLTQVVAGVEPGRVNRPLVSALAERGLFDRLFGSDEITAVELCAIRQGLARVNTEAETAFAVQGLGGIPILLSATDPIRNRWIPAITAGEAVAAFALTEPGAGSDAAALTTSATLDGDGYRLDGEKVYISNAPDADVYTVFARTTRDGGAKGVTAFVVEKGTDGLSGEVMAMLSPHPLGRIVFDGVYVAAEAVLGDIDQGFRVAMRTLDLFRPSVGAFALGMAEAALGKAVAHAGSRHAFGAPISSFQGVSHQLADVRTSIEASRHLVYAAAEAHDSGDHESLTGMAAMAKVFATETAQHAVDVAIQVLGARGLEADSLLAHLYTEVRAPRIYEGTSEIQRNIIARELFMGNI